MKVLPTNAISAAAATSENSAYPAENVFNETPDLYFKADSTGKVTLTCDITGAGNCLGIVNTNARVVDIKVYSVPSDELSLESDLFGADDDLFGADDDYFVTRPVHEETVALGGIRTYRELITGRADFDIRATQIAYPYQYVDHCVVIEFDPAVEGKTVYVGTVTAGVVAESGMDIKYGVGESYMIRSVYKEMNSGTLKRVRQRPSKRTFSPTILQERDTDFRRFMNGIFQQIEYEPALWKITELSGSEWVVYARLQAPAQGTHDYFRHSEMQYSLIEV